MCGFPLLFSLYLYKSPSFERLDERYIEQAEEEKKID